MDAETFIFLEGFSSFKDFPRAPAVSDVTDAAVPCGGGGHVVTLQGDRAGGRVGQEAAGLGVVGVSVEDADYLCHSLVCGKPV